MSLKKKLSDYLATVPPLRGTAKLGEVDLELRRISAAEYVGAAAKTRANQDDFMREIIMLACWLEDKPAFAGEDGYKMICDLFANHPIVAANLYTEVVTFLQSGEPAIASAEKN